jgi:hypothetical protein
LEFGDWGFFGAWSLELPENGMKKLQKTKLQAPEKFQTPNLKTI